MEFSGSVLIRVLDIETLELIEEIEQKNVITKQFYYNWITGQGNTQFGNNIHISTNNNPQYEDYPGISGAITNGTVPVGVISPQQIGSYIQVMRRFNPGASTRQITTISLTDTSSFSFNQGAIAYVSLSSPCTQTTSQILDVYYRINGVPSLVDSYNYYGMHPTIALALMFGTNSGNSTNVIPSVNSLVPLYSAVTDVSSTAPTSAGVTKYTPAFTNTSVGTRGAASQTIESNHGMLKFDWSYSTTQGIGDLHGSIMVNSASTQTYIRNTTAMNITAPNGSKIQPIFSHAASTLSSTVANPFLDSQPSTGTGVLNLTGTWTSGNLPELYKIDIVTGGAVGTATYKFSKRNHFGFFGATYNSVAGLLPAAFNYVSGYGKSHTLPAVGTNTDITLGAYGSRMEKYNETSFIMNDQTGVTRYNCTNHVLETWDATSTPALLATNIKQASVNMADGTIWVACSNTGIYKISANGLTITNFTTSNGLISNSVYGIDIGRNSSIWAVCNGGIVTSPDSGANWTVYNQTPTPNTDPYFNSVDTLLHLNSLVDVKGHTVVASGGAAISSAQSKFGGSSAVFAANTDYITINAGSTYMSYLEDFTIELWIYPTAIGGNRIKKYISSDTGIGVGFSIKETSSNVLEASIVNSSNTTILATSTVAPTLNTWQHLAMVMRNRIVTLYKNGVLIATSAQSTLGINLNSSSANITLSASGTSYYAGYMDEIRITRDVGRYSAAFTPPTAEFVETQGTSIIESPILNNDWASIHYLRVDPSNSEDRLAMVRIGNAALNPGTGLVWWSRHASAAIPNNDFAANSVLMTPRRTPGTFNVSDNSGMWVAVHITNYITRSIFGTTTGGLQISTGGTYPINAVNFIRNSANTSDHLLIMQDNKNIVTYDINLNVISTTVPTSTTYYVTTHPYEGTFVYLGSGVCVGSSLGTAWILNLIGDGKPVSSNIGYLMWDNYGWDGAQWVKDNAGAKTTHSGNELMLHGINANFVNGVTGTSFIAGDYYTASVNDGILKNNAMTMTGSSKHFIVPTKKLTDFDGVVRLYPWTTGVVTWRKVSASLTVNGDNSVSCNIPYRMAYLTAGSKNRVFGDFSISGTFSVNAAQNYDIGVKTFNETEIPTSINGRYNDFAFRVSGGTLNVINAVGTSVFACPGFASTTTWSITRTGTSLQFFSAGVLRYTTVLSSYSLIINARFMDTASGLTPFTVNPITVNSSGTGYYVGLGNSTNGTGIYDTKQNCANILKNGDILINGTPVQNIFATPDSTPIAGSPCIDRECGMLFFNPADAGKTITGEYLMSYQVTTPCNIIPV